MFDLSRSVQDVPVFRATDFRVTEGVLRGEPMSFADDMVMDDVYRLAPDAERAILTIGLGPRLKSFRIRRESALGTAGNAVHLDCSVTLMGADGSTCDVLILVEVCDGMVENTYLLPIGTLSAQQSYRLVAVDRHAATRRFAQIACVSFGAGTRVSMADGSQKPIQDLTPGDLVLTRDSGPRPVRWIGRMTLRAYGSFAPVLIRAGVLGNMHDLLLSADHRVLVYQRADQIGAGRPDILVKVRHLIDGENVLRREGGYVDYVQLLFDSHEIVYAEGIAAESLLISQRNRDMLPDEVARNVSHISPDLGQRVGANYEVAENLLSKPDAVALLRQASTAKIAS